MQGENRIEYPNSIVHETLFTVRIIVLNMTFYGH